MTHAIYRGTVMHARHDRFRRAFSYPVYWTSIDLNALDRLPRLISHNAPNVLSIDDRDYAEPLSAMRTFAPITRLVTNPRVLGYTFNPVSFLLGYAPDGTLLRAIAEVNNNYGGRHRYVLDDNARILNPGQIGFRSTREFFVSPFLHGPMTYEFWFANDLDIAMHVSNRDTGRRALTATFTTIERRDLTSTEILRAIARYPFMGAQTLALIYYQAAKLHLLGAPYRRPAADHRPF